MDNSEKVRAIRQYRKSSLPRLRWAAELHHSFVEAVRCLGGKHQATPKKIMQMMGVTGLKISHIKSHLQSLQADLGSIPDESNSTYIKLFLDGPPPSFDRPPSTDRMYRSMRESTISNEFMAINNYQEKRHNYLRECCQEFREAAPCHGKVIRVPFNCRMGTNILYHEYQETQGSSSSEVITKGSPEIRGTDMKLQKSSELTFLSLGNNQTSESSPINLDLKISSN